MKYSEMGREELIKLESELNKSYEDYKAMNLKLDMSRGKPSIEQLELSMGMMDTLHSLSDYMASNNIDVRNYGCDGDTAGKYHHFLRLLFEYHVRYHIERHDARHYGLHPLDEAGQGQVFMPGSRI